MRNRGGIFLIGNWIYWDEITKAYKIRRRKFQIHIKETLRKEKKPFDQSIIRMWGG